MGSDEREARQCAALPAVRGTALEMQGLHARPPVVGRGLDHAGWERLLQPNWLEPLVLPPNEATGPVVAVQVGLAVVLAGPVQLLSHHTVMRKEVG